MARQFVNADIHPFLRIQAERALLPRSYWAFCNCKCKVPSRISPNSLLSRLIQTHLSTSTLEDNAIHRFPLPVPFGNKVRRLQFPSPACSRVYTKHSVASLRTDSSRGFEDFGGHRSGFCEDVPVSIETSREPYIDSASINWKIAYPDGFGIPGAQTVEPAASLSSLALRCCRDRKGPTLAANIFCRILDALPKNFKLLGSDSLYVTLLDKRKSNGKTKYKKKSDVSSQWPQDIQTQIRSWNSVRDDLVDAFSSIYPCDIHDSTITLKVCTRQKIPLKKEILHDRAKDVSSNFASLPLNGFANPSCTLAQIKGLEDSKRTEAPDIYQELIFCLLHPNVFEAVAVNASPEQRASVRRAFLQCVESFFAWHPDRRHLVDFNRLFAAAGPCGFLDVVDILQQRQQIPHRLSGAGKDSLLQSLFSAGGANAFVAIQIFRDIWTHEFGDQQCAEIGTRVGGTRWSWEMLITACQHRRSLSLLQRLLELLPSDEMRWEAVTVLQKRHPRTGQPLDHWSFLMSRTVCSRIIKRAFPVLKNATVDASSGSISNAAENSCDGNKAVDFPQINVGGKECLKTKESETFVPVLDGSMCAPHAKVYFVGDLRDLASFYLRLKQIQQSRTRVLSAREAITCEQNFRMAPHINDNSSGSAVAASDSGVAFPPSGVTEFPTDEYVFPLFVNGNALIPLAVGLYSFGKGPRGAGLLAVAFCDEVYIVDLAKRQPTYQLLLLELVDWLFTNPFLSKVVYRADYELQSIAFAVDKCGSLGHITHCIDLGQPRARQTLVLRGEESGILRQEELLLRAVERGDLRICFPVFRRNARASILSETESTNECGAVLEADIGAKEVILRPTDHPDIKCIVSRWKQLKALGPLLARPPSAEDLRPAVEFAQSLLRTEQKLRRELWRPVNILGGSALHSLIFDKSAPPNHFRVDLQASQRAADEFLRHAEERCFEWKSTKEC